MAKAPKAHAWGLVAGGWTRPTSLGTTLPIGRLVAPPGVLAPAVPLERRAGLPAVVGRRGLGLDFGEGVSGIPVPIRSGK